MSDFLAFIGALVLIGAVYLLLVIYGGLMNLIDMKGKEWQRKLEEKCAKLDAERKKLRRK